MVDNHITRVMAEARLAAIHPERRINRPLPAAMDGETGNVTRRPRLLPWSRGER
jgi:hypothetical protein